MGSAIAFKCPEATRGWSRTLLSENPSDHVVVRTGATKRRVSRKASPRSMWTSFEYRCACGHVGWSSHTGVLHCRFGPGADLGWRSTTIPPAGLVELRAADGTIEALSIDPYDRVRARLDPRWIEWRPRQVAGRS